MDQLLDGPDREVLVDGTPAQTDHGLRVTGGEQGPGVAGAEGARGHRLLQWSGKLEEPDGVGDGGTGAADAQSDRLMGEAEGVGEPGVGGCLLERVEVLTVEVLGEGQLESLAARFGGGPEDRGDPGDGRLLSGPEAAFTGDQPVAARIGLDDDGVEEPVSADGIGQGRERFGVEGSPRLLGVGRDQLGIDLDQRGAAAQIAAGVAAGEQGVEAPSEAVPVDGRRESLVMRRRERGRARPRPEAAGRGCRRARGRPGRPATRGRRG